MAEGDEDGYQEIGKALAQPVAEGVRGIRWAADIAKMLGYRMSDVKAWVERYSEEHSEQLEEMRRERMKKLRRIEQLQERSGKLKRRPPGA